MKLFMLLAVAALIAGGIYHKQVSQYVANLKADASQSNGTPTVLGSIIGTSNASTSLMNSVSNGVDNTLDR